MFLCEKSLIDCRLATIIMKPGLLHEQTPSGTMSGNLCYDLDSERYPTLGNEFFTHLRQKYPRAFRRTVPCDAGKLSIISSASSEDIKSVWSLWDCNDGEDKAVMMEAGGTLLPRCDLSVDERLKRISNSFSSVKSTSSDLITSLRSLRNALLADNSNLISSHLGTENISQVDSGSVLTHDGFYGCMDATSNVPTSSSVSRNSSCDTKSLHDVPKEDSVPRVSSFQTTSYDVQPGIVIDVSGTDTTLKSHRTEGDAMPVQSVDVSACNPDTNTLLEEYPENQLPSADELRSFPGDVALPVECNRNDTNQGLVNQLDCSILLYWHIFQ